MKISTSDQVLVVVYAVLWAGILPTFGRLRAFAINRLFDCHTPNRLPRATRFLVALILGNLAPVTLLVALLRWLPEPAGWWGAFVAALAGISPVIFPRLLHTFTLSDGPAEWFYPDKVEREAVLDDWDCLKESRVNTFRSHLLATLAVGLPTLGLAWFLGWVLT